MEKTEDFEKYYVEVIMQGKTDDERSTLPLSSSAATEKVCYQQSSVLINSKFEFDIDASGDESSPKMLFFKSGRHN